jgi:hypothetical protein
MKLEADVKIAVAFLVAHALDLVRTHGREFAKYVRVFSSSVVVSKQDVTEYEMHIQTQLFGRVRASVPDVDRTRPSGLAAILRSMGTSFRSSHFLSNSASRFMLCMGCASEFR